MSKKVSTMINVFDSIFKDYSWFNDQEQYEIHLGRFSRGFMSAYNELQSTITAQEETIKRLREAGENIRQEAVTQEPFSEPEGYSYITAWDDLMNELGEK
jgi:hypothetical protein